MAKNIFKLQSRTLKYYHYGELRAMYFGNNRGNKILRQDWDEEERLEDDEYRRERELEMQKILKCAVRFLTDNEFQCFYLFFFSDVSQDQIANLMEVSQPMINKFLKKGIEKIKRIMCQEMKQLTFDLNM